MYSEEKERRMKDMMIFPIGGGEATNPVNMEGLYVSIRSGGMEEEDNIPFP